MRVHTLDSGAHLRSDEVICFVAGESTRAVMYQLDGGVSTAFLQHSPVQDDRGGLYRGRHPGRYGCVLL